MTVLCALMLGTVATHLRADDTSGNISIGKMITNLKIAGDMRVRQENFWKSTAGQTDRSRQRFRFRLGIEPQLQDITVGFRIASGTGEQVSTNQSFTTFSSQKGLWIDQANLQWKALPWLKLMGGKMFNPLWRLYSSDIVFDDDFNPEGFAQQLDYTFCERLSVFANLTQVALDEDSSDNRDQWMLAYQAGFQTKLFNETKWTLAASLIDLDNEMANNFSQTTVEEGNTRFPGSATSTTTAYFTMIHLTTELKSKIGPLPFSVQADYVNNIADNSVNPTKASAATTLPAQVENVGYQVGMILNKAAKPMSWEAAYFFKWLETNASLADMVDADFGDGGTNRRGHIMWLAFSPREYVQLKAKLFVTEVIRPGLAPGADNINRMQLDMSVKF